MQPKPKKALNPATERLRQARLRERRKSEGWRRVTVWLNPQEAATLETLGDEWLGRTVKALLCEAMDDTQTTKGLPPVHAQTPAPVPVPGPETFTLELVPERDPNAEQGAVSDTGREPPADILAEVDSLLARGLSGEAIARQFNAQGWRTKTGAEYRGANLLRDWRKWKGAV